MAALSNRVLRDIHMWVELKTYNMNQIVFYEGDPANFILIVKEGQFEVSRNFDEDNCYLCYKPTAGPLDKKRVRDDTGKTPKNGFQNDEYFIN